MPQVVTEYAESELDMVLEACEGMNNHLTAAVVSNDVGFQRRVLAQTVNGTTYCGIRARWVRKTQRKTTIKPLLETPDACSCILLIG